jgi:hypothetical protein
MASESAAFEGASWQSYSTAPKFTLSTGSGEKTVHFKVKGGDVESAVMSDKISALSPAVTAFKIAAGALGTASGSVTLNNTVTNSPTHYMASESDTFAGAIWQKYSGAPSFALSSGNVQKKVYFKVKNSFAESSPASSDTIDALAPTVTSFKINTGAVATANGTVTLNNTAKNSPTHYMASESDTFAGASWQVYSTAPKFALSDGTGQKTVHFKVKNSFAESAPWNDTISTAGLLPVVTSFRINAGALTTANGTVTLNNTATNLPMYYMASENPGFAGGSWQTYSTAPKFTLSLSSGPKTIYFKTKNIFGESTVKNDTIEVSGLPPVVTSFSINSGVSSTTKETVTLSNVAAYSPMEYMASESPTFDGASWQTYSTAPKFTLSAGSATKTLYFKTRNIFGESYVVSDTIGLIQ